MGKRWKNVENMYHKHLSMSKQGECLHLELKTALIDQLGCSLEKWARPSYVNSNQQLAAPAKLSQKHNVRKCALN